jgi:hypothetical protein
MPSSFHESLMENKKVRILEQGWALVAKGIKKLETKLEGLPEQQFESEEVAEVHR